MCMTMQRQHGFVALQRPFQTRTAEKRKDRLRLPNGSLLDRSVTRDRDLHGRMELCEAIVELDRFASLLS